MISLMNSTAQTLTAGQTMAFDTVVFHTGCSECYRKGTGSVKMTRNGIYEVSFNANVTAATAGDVVQLSIQQGGVTVPESTMISTPAAANAVNNVACDIPLQNCCDYERITVVNTGTTDVVISANAQLFVKRVA